MDLPSGSILKNGNYQIEKTLGMGGFGITYMGKYCPSQIPVAIKENWPDTGIRQGTYINWVTLTPKRKQEEIEKFKQEAEILSECVHPNLVNVYDYFEDNNTAYIVMELISGKPLIDLLETSIFPEQQVIHYGLQIASSLQVIHNKNYIHRDIKPANILITPDNKAIVIDFGATREYIANRTGKMTAILTPGYAPIEQYRSFNVRGPGTDIYALCATMYHLLTGEIPPESVTRYNSDRLKPLNYYLPKILPKLETIIMRGLAVELENRFPSSLELIKALNQLQPEIKGRLISLARTTTIQEFILNPQENILGIAQVNPHVTIDLGNFPNNDTVSRQHGKIFRVGNQWKIQDLNSTNGTFIKHDVKTQFSPKITAIENLNCGDEIAFGKVRFLFQTF